MRSIRRKQTFGSMAIAKFSPPLGEGVPKAINVGLTFEDALKLHLGLGQLLGHLNSYDRSTKAGKRSAVNICVCTQAKRITINEGHL